MLACVEKGVYIGLYVWKMFTMCISVCGSRYASVLVCKEDGVHMYVNECKRICLFVSKRVGG